MLYLMVFIAIYFHGLYNTLLSQRHISSDKLEWNIKVIIRVVFFNITVFGPSGVNKFLLPAYIVGIYEMVLLSISEATLVESW